MLIKVSFFSRSSSSNSMLHGWPNPSPYPYLLFVIKTCLPSSLYLATLSALPSLSLSPLSLPQLSIPWSPLQSGILSSRQRLYFPLPSHTPCNYLHPSRTGSCTQTSTSAPEQRDPKETGELGTSDVSDQSASFWILLALKTLRAEPSWHVSCHSCFSFHPKAPNLPLPPSPCRGHRVVVSVCCVEHMFVISASCTLAELRVRVLTMKNLSQPGAKWEEEGNRCYFPPPSNTPPNISQTLCHNGGRPATGLVPCQSPYIL